MTTMVPPMAVDRRIDDLLEVSRRLTAATVSTDIERAVVREAMGLVSSTAAALVRIGPGGLSVAHQSQPDLLVVEPLGAGVIERVAETGQPVMQVSATEPAVRFLPVALIGVPLVSGGRVEAVLIEVRSAQMPFGAAERERLMALAPVAAAALQSAQEAAAAIEESLVDPLTGVGNRRRMDAELGEVLAEAGRRPTSLIMVDLDHFKAVNDAHGHPAGDALLQGVAGILRDTVRPGDGVYRYGGEEFVVVLPRTEEEAAADVAERLRAAIATREFEVGEAKSLRATASFGLAATTSNDPSGLIARADAALYRAKESGRDRVVCAGATDQAATNARPA
jgi:diguanylate cyclase (GGDEF)-like protein